MMKKIMIKKSHWKGALLTVIAIAFLAVATGCSKIEKAISDAEQGEVIITKEDGKQLTISGNRDIPDDFPSDIPLPDEIVVDSSMSGNDTVTLVIETEMAFDDVVALYYNYAQQAGYTEVHRLGDENTIHYSSQRGTERFVFALSLDLEDNKTVYGTLVYSNKPETEQ